MTNEEYKKICDDKIKAIQKKIKVDIDKQIKDGSFKVN
jgi:hypothetical protein